MQAMSCQKQHSPTVTSTSVCPTIELDNGSGPLRPASTIRLCRTTVSDPISCCSSKQVKPRTLSPIETDRIRPSRCKTESDGKSGL